MQAAWRKATETHQSQGRGNDAVAGPYLREPFSAPDLRRANQFPARSRAFAKLRGRSKKTFVIAPQQPAGRDGAP